MEPDSLKDTSLFPAILGCTTATVLGTFLGALGGGLGFPPLESATEGTWRGALFMFVLAVAIWPLLWSLRPILKPLPASFPTTICMVVGILAAAAVALFYADSWFWLVLVGTAAGFVVGRLNARFVIPE